MLAAMAVMFLVETTIMPVAITGMSLGPWKSPWNYPNVIGFCRRFVPGNSPGLGVGYRDWFAFSM